MIMSRTAVKEKKILRRRPRIHVKSLGDRDPKRRFEGLKRSSAQVGKPVNKRPDMTRNQFKEKPATGHGLLRQDDALKRLVAALQESEGRYRSLVRSLPDLIARFDLNLKHMYVSPSFTKMLGQPDAIIGKGIEEIAEAKSQADLYNQKLREAMSSGKTTTVEATFRSSQGPRYFHSVMIPERDRQGSVATVLAVTREVTELKKADEALRESVSLLRATLESTADGILVVDREGKVSTFSRRFAEMWRIPEPLLETKDHAKLLQFVMNQLDDPKQFLEKVQQLYSEPESESFDILRFKDGRVFERHSQPQTIGEEIVGRVWSFRDVTQRKRAEEALRENEERYRTLVEGAVTAVGVADPIGRLTYVNKALADLLGYSAKELLGRSFVDFLRPEDKDRVMSMFPQGASAQEKAPDVEFRVLRKDGNLRHVWTRPTRLAVRGETAGFEVIVVDITERKRMEEKLKALHRLALQLNMAGSIDGIINRTLDAMEFALGFDHADFCVVRDGSIYIQQSRGMPGTVSELPSEGPSVIVKAARTKKALRVRDTRKEPAFLDAPAVGPRGELQHMLSELAVPVLVDSKTVALLNVENTRVDAFTEQDQMLLETLAADVASALDRLEQNEELRRYSGHLERLVSERTRRLAESERRFRELADLLPEIVFEVDAKANVTYFNRVGLESGGYSEGDIRRGLNALQLFAPEDRERAMTQVQRILNREEAGHNEYTAQRKDGSTFPVVVHSNLISVEGKPVGVRGVAVDMTEQKQMQQRLLRAERLAAIGELAAMVGHDLRNPLTSITGAAYYLNTKLGPKLGIREKEMLAIIEKSIRYSDKIVNDLLEYSRELRLELVEADPRSITRDALAHITVPRGIRIADSTENEPKIRVDTEKMRRVFLNLMQNAFDAMPQRGTLTIASQKSNDNLQISFVDSGVGMKKEIVESLWSPLFTTKAKGMGLGLPVAKRFVEGHGGSIRVESQPGKGSTFTVTLPITPKTEEMKKG
ncbi:MAG: PAS domain S-box protein [Candidatus Bathyarchaeia archaeon]|jgi:PAS domain S-box-containing protein